MTDVIAVKPPDPHRWFRCGDKNSACAIMADVVTPQLQHQLDIYRQADMANDHRWLETELAKFRLPPLPGISLEVLSSSEIRDPRDWYGILITAKLPDSNGSGEAVSVGRLGFSTAAAFADYEMLGLEVRGLLQALAQHEIDEWLLYDGVHVHEPHLVG